MRRTETKIPFFLIGRFIARSSRWTLGLTIGLMAIAFVNLVFVASLFAGIVKGSNEQVINAYVGHVSVGPVEGQREIQNVGAQLANIMRTPGVVGASAQSFVPTMMQYGNISLAREVLAIDPLRERTVTNIANRIVAGSFLRPDDTDGILLGIQVAGGPDVELNGSSFRGAQVGDVVMLAMGFGIRPFIVRGIFRTKLLTSDLRAFITQRALEQSNPGAHDQATTIIVRDGQTGHEHAIIDGLRRHGVVGTFTTWEDNAGIMKTVTRSFTSINLLMSVLGLLIAAVTIFIVIYIDVMNRKRQIGILRALGIKAWIIRVTYMLQSAVYSLAGIAIGLIIFFALIVPYFRMHPLSLPICDAMLAIDPKDLAHRAEAVLLVGIVSGLIPAAFATRIALLDAIAGR